MSSVAAKAALATGEWVEKTDPKGRKYFYQKATKKTTWDLDKELAKGGTPAAPAAAAAPSSSSAQTPADLVKAALASGEWVEKTDPKGRKYFYQKSTKKTTWDLEKELAKDLKDEGQKAAATPTKTEPTAVGGDPSDPYRFASVEQAIASGEWSEKKDKSGKVYYSHKPSRTTVWDLQKELAQRKPEAAAVAVPATEVVPAAQNVVAQEAASAAAVGAASSPLKQVRPSDLTYEKALASGEWEQVKDYQGVTFYINRKTSETTADLKLYMEIQRAIAEGEPDLKPIPTFSGASLDSYRVTPLPTPDHVDDWVSLMLNAPQHEDSASRLLSGYRHRLDNRVKGDLEDKSIALNEMQQRNKYLEGELNDSKAMLQRQRDEIHQLQCALFYGLGPYGKAMGGQSGIIAGVPAGMDPALAASGNDATVRIGYLERLLLDVQNHNRLLQKQLEEERLTKHRESHCGHCFRADPWTRITEIGNASGVAQLSDIVVTKR